MNIEKVKKRIEEIRELEPFSDMEDMYGLTNSRKIDNIAEMGCNYETLTNLTENNLGIAGKVFWGIKNQ